MFYLHKNPSRIPISESVDITELDEVMSTTSVAMKEALLYFFTKSEIYLHEFTINEKGSKVTVSLSEKTESSPFGTVKFLESFAPDLAKPFKNGGCNAITLNVYKYKDEGIYQLPTFMSFFCVSSDQCFYYFHRLSIENLNQVRNSQKYT